MGETTPTERLDRLEQRADEAFERLDVLARHIADIAEDISRLHADRASRREAG